MALLDDVKRHLDILSCDDQTDKKVKLIIARAKNYLRRFNPALNDSDFEDKENLAYLMLLDWCRYDYSNASEDFSLNYKDEIIQLRNQYKVKMYEVEEPEGRVSDF